MSQGHWNFQAIFGLSMLWALIACGSASTGSGGGSSDSGSIQDVTDNLVSASGAMIPELDSSGSSSLTSWSVSYSDSEFDALVGDYRPFLNEIFGSSEEEPRVVTKIRVLLDNFVDDFSMIPQVDPEMDCQFTSEAVSQGFVGEALPDADTVELAFFGEVDNGDSANRNFDCVFSEDSEENGTETYLYGSDASGNVYLAMQTENREATNTEQTETRGDAFTLVQIVYGVYHQSTVDSTQEIDLDLQYAQASIYSGPDNSMTDVDDNVIFKSRTHITGNVSLDADGNVLSSASHFNIVKLDQAEGDSGMYTTTIKSAGRGNFEVDGSFIFSFDYLNGSESDIGGLQTYCVRQEDAGDLAAASQDNCTAFETALPFEELAFEYSPLWVDAFENNEMFDADDLIENDASDFTIPSY